MGPSGRQLSMVIDLNKCIGCHTCTVACKTLWTSHAGADYMYWNNVETRPGDGYPRRFEEMGGGYDEQGSPVPGRQPEMADYGVAWNFDYDNVLASGSSFQLRPDADPDWGPNWDEDQGDGEFPNNYYFYLPRLCNHCSNPPCLHACPNKAIYKRQEDGIVLIDQERCQGLRFCVAACPYKKIYFNPRRSKSEKCIFCYPRVERGVAMACARQCVGRARWVGDREDHEGPIFALGDRYSVALPLHEEWGTQPNVFYVPPFSPPAYDSEGRPTQEPRIPASYLEMLFGPRVHIALKTLEQERVKNSSGAGSELMDILIAYRHSDMFALRRG